MHQDNDKKLTFRKPLLNGLILKIIIIMGFTETKKRYEYVLMSCLSIIGVKSD